MEGKVKVELYYRYSEYLKNKYGVKTYKLPVNIPASCPNRDGLLGKRGCAFCGEKGAGFENLPSTMSVKEQLLKNKEYIGGKYGAEKFIAYFQNFTTTYLPLNKLKQYIKQVMEIEDIVEISFSTRPDCLNDKYIEEMNKLIQDSGRDIKLSLELGLQTVNYHTLCSVNRGHTLAEYIDAVLKLKKHRIIVGTHLILNLPGDDLVDVLENSRILSALKIDNVKLHALYIREGTLLGEKYKAGELRLIRLEEYIERVIRFLELLDPSIAVQRFLGRVPEEGTLFVNWDHSWWKIQQMIIEEMKNRKTFQGKKFDYLNGKALRDLSN